MKKYEEGLTDEELDNQIAQIEGELLPKEKPNPNLQNVIVDGYIFEIDRSVPKIVDYIGPADGVIITAYITGNDGWIKEDEYVTVSGTIKTYSGGIIESSIATSNGVKIADFPSKGGNYNISNITNDTEIIIIAKDNKGKENEKRIPITIKIDNTPPTINSKIVADGWKIIINATATDNESGIKSSNYTITPSVGISEENISGTIENGKNIEIITTLEKEYTITITAMDNCENKTTKIDKVTSGIMTMSEAREKVKESTLQQYIGVRISDYIPINDNEGKYRVFYYDNDGKFGIENTLYLKRTGDNINYINLKDYGDYSASTEGKRITLQMNPMWASYGESVLDIDDGKRTSWVCDPENWKDYLTNDAKFAIGGPSVEMFIDSYNIWKNRVANKGPLRCEATSKNGYLVGNIASEKLAHTTGNYVLEEGPGNIYSSDTYWISSPCETEVNNWGLLYVNSYWKSLGGIWQDHSWRCNPLICIKNK